MVKFPSVAQRTDTKSYIAKFMKEVVGTDRYSFDKEGRVNVMGDVKIMRQSFTELPFAFGMIFGDFLCCLNGLTSFKNFPVYVKGVLSCQSNQITSLKGCTQKIGESFLCCLNPINEIKFEDLPEHVGGMLNFQHPQENKIKFLEEYYKKNSASVALELDLPTLRKILFVCEQKENLENKLEIKYKSKKMKI